MPGRIVLYGATGYMGALTARRWSPAGCTRSWRAVTKARLSALAARLRTAVFLGLPACYGLIARTEREVRFPGAERGAVDRPLGSEGMNDQSHLRRDRRPRPGGVAQRLRDDAPRRAFSAFDPQLRLWVAA